MQSKTVIDCIRNGDPDQYVHRENDCFYIKTARVFILVHDSFKFVVLSACVVTVILLVT